MASGFGHVALHNFHVNEIIALATKLGTGSSTASSGTVLRGNGSGTSAWGQVDASTDLTTMTSATLRGLLTDETGTGAAVFGTAPALVGGGSWAGSPTFSTPTVANFTNSQHDHSNAAGGGNIGTSGLSSSAVTAAKMGTPYTCSLYKTSDQIIGSAVPSIVSWNGEVFDTGALHDTVTNNSRVTIPANFAGYWQIRGELKMTGGTSGGRLIAIYKNGSQWRLSRPGSPTNSDVSPAVFDILLLAAGDYIEILAYADGGTNVTIQGGAPLSQDWSSFVVSFLGAP